MANMIKLACAGYKEFWLDVDLVVSVGIGTVNLDSAHGPVATEMTVISTASGGKNVFPLDCYQPIMQAKMGPIKEPEEPAKGDIPAAYFSAWDDVKGDEDTDDEDDEDDDREDPVEA